MIILAEQPERSRTILLSFRTILLFLFALVFGLPEPIDTDEFTGVSDVQFCIRHSIYVDLNAVNRRVTPVIRINELGNTAPFLLVDRLMNCERQGIEGLCLGANNGGGYEGESDQKAGKTH
jgi:hypothetical protein